MSRKKKQHWHELPGLLKRYADARKLEFCKFNAYHYRLIDEGYTAIDIWTTGRYNIVKTNYRNITTRHIFERSGEHGRLPRPKIDLGRFLDKVFYAADTLEENHMIE